MATLPSFRLAVVGRPNVGKSTLFNRLTGKALALIDPRPGSTRDWRAAPAQVAGLRFTAIDTAGLETAEGDSLAARLADRTDQALAEADAVLFLIDGRAGVTPQDELVAERLRPLGLPIILAANKCESRAGRDGLMEAFSLGFGAAIPMSAAHGDGMGDLADRLLELAPELDTAPEEEGEDPPIRVAIVGRPNVGKSTLVNALLGEDRVLTGPEAGLTRDSVHLSWTWEGHRFRLVDTAGLRRRSRVDDVLEKAAGDETRRAIRLAQVVVLVIDATLGIEHQDLTIAEHVAEEGRALVVCINKWDLPDQQHPVAKAIDEALEDRLAQVPDVPRVFTSALYGRALDKLARTIVETFQIWGRLVPTSGLNRYLAEAQERHPPPLVHGHSNKIRFMRQVRTRPPSFALWVRHPDALPDSYVRYLANGLRAPFGLKGVPVRMSLRPGRPKDAPDD